MTCFNLGIQQHAHCTQITGIYIALFVVRGVSDLITVLQGFILLNVS